MKIRRRRSSRSHSTKSHRYNNECVFRYILTHPSLWTRIYFNSLTSVCLCVCTRTLHDHLRLMAKYITHFSRRSLSLAVDWDTHTHTFLWSKSLLHIMMAISSSFIHFVRKKSIIYHWSNYLLTSSLNNSDRSGDRHIRELNDRGVLTGKMVIGRSQKKIICSRRHVNSIH